jgi:hypothetical protein
MISAPDRRERLVSQSVVTGIDFIYVHPDQRTLDIYFLRPASTLDDPLFGFLTPGDIRIYSPTGAAAPVAVTKVDWLVTDGHEVMQLTTVQPGTFALYRLRINDERIDPFYNDLTFSFKANCPSDLDCAPPGHECPPEAEVDVPIDYLARDFWSFRQALLEFASLRYPDWKDRLAADAGVMLVELMSAVGDEMAYYQDRIGQEAFLETASQRRSIRRHARLVDYPMHDGQGAFAWLDIKVKPGASGNITSGTNFWALSEQGLRTDFELGQGLKEALALKKYFVDAARNQFEVYRWDEDQDCLPVGTTEMYISGHHATTLSPFDDLPSGKLPGKWVLLKTAPVNPAQSARAHMVRLVSVTDRMDPVLVVPLTKLVWEQAQALPFEMDMTVLFVCANMVPVTSGKTEGQYFITGADVTELEQAAQEALTQLALIERRPVMRAVEREGSNDAIAYLSSLLLTEEQNLVWLGNKPEEAIPEVHLEQLQFISPAWVVLSEPWLWQRSLVGVHSSQSTEQHFTLDDGIWRRVVGYQRQGAEIIHRDYATGNGVTIRFGDGEFGLIPKEGSVFRVMYRVGGTRSSNVAPGAIQHFDIADPALNFIQSITNPLNAVNGKDPETFDEVRQSAPEAFRAITYRAVRPEDYAEAAERLPWVQKAGAVFRWTGSWLTAFVTPDPKNAVTLTEEWRVDLENQLNRFRQAGREIAVMDPVYADIDLEIDICAAPEVFPGEVKERVMARLVGKKGIRPGYFSPDNFTFGTPLERSTLEAAIQSVPGVKAVEAIRFRRRGVFDWKPFDNFFYEPEKNAIIRIQNDRLHPERGIIKLYIHGGA